MPIYTYKCQACSRVIERRQSFSDAPLTTCESCSGELRKLLSPPAIVFKGSGFYNTDYRGSNGTAAGESKSDAETKSESKDSTKSDSTSTSSAAKSETTSTTKTEATTAGASTS